MGQKGRGVDSAGEAENRDNGELLGHLSADCFSIVARAHEPDRFTYQAFILR